MRRFDKVACAASLAHSLGRWPMAVTGGEACPVTWWARPARPPCFDASCPFCTGLWGSLS